MTSRFSQLFTLASAVLLSTGCKNCKPPEHPEQEQTQAPRFSGKLPQGEDTALRWLATDNPEDLRVVFDQRGLKAGLVRTQSCTDISQDVWNAIPNNLVTLHNALSKKADTTDAYKPVDAWITNAANVATFNVAFTARDFSSSASAGLKYGPVSVKAGFQGSTSSVSMVLASTARAVSLTPAARTCIETNLCLQNEEGGEYVSTAVYGSMIRLALNEGTIKADASVEATVLPIDVSFSLEKKNISLQGGYIGRFNATPASKPEDIAGLLKSKDIANQTIGTDAVLELLRNNDILEVGTLIESATTEYGVIAVRVESITKDKCQQLRGSANGG